MAKKLSLPKSAAGAAAFTLATSLCAATAAWEKLPSLPEPNGGSVVGVAGGHVAVVGGTNWKNDVKQWLTTVYFLDPVKMEWKAAKPLPQPIAYAVGGGFGGQFVIVGGSTGKAPFPGVIRVDGTAGAASSEPAGGIAGPAVLSAGGVVGDEVLFTGGTDDAANLAGFHRSSYALNLRTGQRRTLPDYPGPAVGTAASIGIGSELFVFGGATGDLKTKAVVNLDGAYALSATSGQWRTLKPLPYAVRGISAAALNERYLYLAGGFDSVGFTDRAVVYDLKEDRYLPAPALPMKAGTSMVASGGYVYCVAGEDRMKHRTDLAFRIPVTALLPETKP